MATNIFFGNKPIINKTPINYTRSTNPLIINIDPAVGPLDYPELSAFYRMPEEWDEEDDDSTYFDPDTDVVGRTYSSSIDSTPDVPTDLKIDIKTAKYHKSQDGRQLVDVKLTFSEVSGADGYEVSISGKGTSDD